MGCQSKVIIGNNLTFSVTTHTTGSILTDADGAPAYRVYEDETGTAILTGTMSKLDDAGTTGFYTGQIACTAANGFEDGKTYTIYISATVSSDTGGISFGFEAMTAVWSTTTRVLTSSSTAPGTGLSASVWTVYRGDTLDRTFSTIAADGTITKVQLTVKTHPDDDQDLVAILMIDSTSDLVYLNGGSPKSGCTGTFNTSGVLAVNATTMSNLKAGEYSYDIQVWRTAAVSTIEIGTITVKNDISRATAV